MIEQRKRERVNVKHLKAELNNEVVAQELIQEIAEKIQQQAHQRIAVVVSKALSTVFADDAYAFAIEFVKKRGKTEARLLFYRDGYSVEPLEAAGGGAVDIAAFALRLACVIYSRPNLRRLLILDEPFRHLSPALIPQINEMLRVLSRETQTQIILATHLEGLDCGKTVRVEG